jgi:hypothetical protein
MFAVATLFLPSVSGTVRIDKSGRGQRDGWARAGRKDDPVSFAQLTRLTSTRFHPMFNKGSGHNQWV